MKFAAGINHQYMTAVQRPILSSIWFSADRYLHDSQSDHLILGYEYQIGGNLYEPVETFSGDGIGVFGTAIADTAWISARN